MLEWSLTLNTLCGLLLLASGGSVGAAFLGKAMHMMDIVVVYVRKNLMLWLLLLYPLVGTMLCYAMIQYLCDGMVFKGRMRDTAFPSLTFQLTRGVKWCRDVLFIFVLCSFLTVIRRSP